MNEVIAKGLMSQLDVLKKYLVEDYYRELNGKILPSELYHHLVCSVTDCMTELNKL